MNTLGENITVPSVEEMIGLCENLQIKPTSQICYDIRSILKRSGIEPFQQVQEAKERLLHIQRFQGLTMHVRDTVSMHIERLRYMLHVAQHSLDLTFSGFPFAQTEFIIDRHDMPEGMSPLGDIPTHLKRRLSPALSALLQSIEASCHRIIAHIPDMRVLGDDPRIFSSANADARLLLFQAYEKKKEVWTQVVKYFDILDAYMETLLEAQKHGNRDFLPIAKRYREEIETIGCGEYLPAIRRVYKKRRKIQKWLDETFGPHEWFPRDSVVHAEQYEIFCGGLGLFDFEDLKKDRPKAFDFWRKHIFPRGPKKRPEWFTHGPQYFGK